MLTRGLRSPSLTQSPFAAKPLEVPSPEEPMPFSSCIANRWFDVLSIPTRQPPPDVAPWLLDPGSLTTRLVKTSGGNFAVRVLHQGWGKPTADEAELLGLPYGQYAWLRETALLCHGETWVYARSVMPLKTLSGKLRFLQRLKNSSLGALLFRDPGLTRSRFQIAQLPLRDLPLARIGLVPKHPDACVWGRRSLFQFHGRPILVGEIFLPTFRPK
jgi:chorismate--pyruvate lyase